MQKKAIEIMKGWLSHENELGKEPAKIEAVGQFEYEENQYVIIKFKAKLLSKWNVGVVGFDSEGEECGHTFSEFEVYNKDTAKEKCIAMIEYLKEYWKSRFAAELEHVGITEEEYENMSEEEFQEKVKEKEEEGKASRQGFLLLDKPEYDFEQLGKDLSEYFNLEIKECEERKDTLIFNVEDNMVVISLMEFPIPEGEAEHYAQANMFWKEAVEVAKNHQAHIMVIVMNQKKEPIEAACCFTDIVDICMFQKNVSGIYTAGTVLAPEEWKDGAKMLHAGQLPINLWVYVGLGRGENGNNGYTYGMDEFGHLEMEIINSSQSLENIYDFLYNLCDYVIKTNMRFRDGETVSFNSDNKLTVTKSKAVYVEGESFKIGY